MKFTITTSRDYPYEEGDEVQLGVFVYAGSAEIEVLQGAITKVLLDYANEDNLKEISD